METNTKYIMRHTSERVANRIIELILETYQCQTPLCMRQALHTTKDNTKSHTIKMRDRHPDYRKYKYTPEGKLLQVITYKTP